MQQSPKQEKILRFICIIVQRCTECQCIQEVDQLIDLRLRNLPRRPEAVPLSPHLLTDKRGKEDEWNIAETVILAHELQQAMAVHLRHLDV